MSISISKITSLVSSIITSIVSSIVKSNVISIYASLKSSHIPNRSIAKSLNPIGVKKINSKFSI